MLRPSPVMSREAFGPMLRRIRVLRHIGLARIVVSTQIPEDLLEGLERSDFSRWPTGIYARAYVRQYAEAIGLDPEPVVNEFCRWFPEGDRRAERLIRDCADLAGHELEWRDEKNLGRRRTDPPRDGAPMATDAGAPPLVLTLRRRR